MNYLIEHAKRWIWCNPCMDRTCNIKLQRISVLNGAIKTMSMPWFTLPLPDPIAVYHVFFIGHIPTFNLGMDALMVTNRWYNLCDLMSNNYLVLNVFKGSAIDINKALVSILFTTTKGAILAIKDSPLVDISESTVYCRIYKNSYFSSDRRREGGLGVTSVSLMEYTNSQLVDFVNAHNEKTLLDQGDALACVNGFWYHRLNTQYIENASVIDSVYDEAIERVYDFYINRLQTFLSDKDKKRKYVIHLDNQNDSPIYYYDDCDFYVGYRTATQPMVAIRIPTVDRTAIRQITHRDYSISIDVVSLIIRQYFNDINEEELTLWVVVRQSGYDRALWYVNDKIRALYKLSDTDIIDAMVNIDSTVWFWNSEHLENSAYPKLMGELYDIEQSCVVECYGYRGLLKALANNLMPVRFTDDSLIDIPYNYQSNALVIEYDNHRYLRSIHAIENQHLYSIDRHCTLLEFVNTNQLNGYMSVSVGVDKHCLILALTLDKAYNYYRVWLNHKALIINIDFKIVNNGLYIYNKEFLNTDLSDIVIIADGLNTEEYILEQGYVIDNTISINSIYNYYDDRLIKVIANGKVYSIDEVWRLENKKAIESIKEGSPYCVEQLNPDVTYPNIDFEALKGEAISKEALIQDYLSLKIPQSTDIPFTLIEGYYCLYSVFIARIIFDLQTEDLVIPDRRVDDNELDALLVAYKPLLAIDIAADSLDTAYVRIHPHPYTHTLFVKEKQYIVIERIIKLYKLTISDLSAFLQIES